MRRTAARSTRRAMAEVSPGDCVTRNEEMNNNAPASNMAAAPHSLIFLPSFIRDDTALPAGW